MMPRALAGADRHKGVIWLIAALVAVALVPAIFAGSARAATASWGFEPATVDVGTFLPGEEAPEPTRLRLANTGEEWLDANFEILIPNPDSSFRVLYDGCRGPIAPGGGCVVEVAFKPLSPGPKEATLEVADTEGLVPPAVAHLTGAGTAPTVTIDPPSIDFGTVPARGERPTRTATVTNQGPSELSISGVEIVALAGWAQTEPFASQIRWNGGTCHSGASLPAGGTCTVDVEFAPDRPGFDAAEIRLTDDAADSPQAIHLSGTAAPEATPPPPPPAAEEPRAILGRHPAKRTKARTATFTFSGNATVAGFVCRLDRGPFRPCTSPTTYRSLKLGHHQFTVRATGSDGAQTPGATYGWQVVKQPAPKKHRRHKPVR
jgi:hypothetical protein